MQNRQSIRASVLVVLMTAMVGPAASLDPAGGEALALMPPGCAEPMRMVPGTGQACPTDDGLWGVLMHDGVLRKTHGPDPPFPDLPEPDATAQAVQCIGDNATEYHMYAVYARPVDKASNYNSVLGTIRSRINSTNGILREEAGEFSVWADFKFHCDGNGQVFVANVTLPTNSTSDSYTTITNNLSQAGYNSNRAHYWVFYDDGVGGYCGQSYVGGNYGPQWGVSYGQGCWTTNTVMHESGHSLSAVRTNAPETSGAWHCNDGLDIMCYGDGGSNASYTNQRCTDRTHYDCNHNSYFNPKPNPGHYLSTSWSYNLARRDHLFLVYENECGTGADAGNNATWATNLALPVTACTGRLGSSDTLDWYRFEVHQASGSNVNVSVAPHAKANFDVCLYAPSNTSSAVACSSSAGAGAVDSIAWAANEDGPWRVRVNQTGPVTGNYTLAVSVDTPHNDCTRGQDAGASHAQALLLGTPVMACPASLPLNDTADWYRFSAASGQVVNVTMTPNAGADFDVCLFTPSDAANPAACSANATLGARDRVLHAANETGEWRARVLPANGTGSYTLSVFLGPADDCGAGDAGMNASAARAVSVPLASCTGSFWLSASDDGEDWYRFFLWASQKVTFTATPNPAADVDVCILRPNATTVACAWGGNGTADAVTYTATQNGDWLAQVFAYSGWHFSNQQGGGGYNVSATVAPNDCKLNADAASTHAAAQTITPPVTNCNAMLNATDAEDWYRFNVVTSQNITVTMGPNSSVDFDLCLYTPTNATSPVACSNSTALGQAESIVHTATEGGLWRARVYRPSGSATGDYLLSVSLAANDCGTGVDAGATHAAATLVGLPKTDCAAALSSTSDNDYYKFNASANDTLKLSMKPSGTNNYDLCLYTPTNTTAVQCSTNTTGGALESIAYTATEAGDWRARVYRTGGSAGNYTMSVCRNC